MSRLLDKTCLAQIRPLFVRKMESDHHFGMYSSRRRPASTEKNIVLKVYASAHCYGMELSDYFACVISRSIDLFNVRSRFEIHCSCMELLALDLALFSGAPLPSKQEYVSSLSSNDVIFRFSGSCPVILLTGSLLGLILQPSIGGTAR